MNATRALLSFALVALGSLVTGCGSQLSAVELNPAPPGMASRSPASVEVFASSPPSRPHVDVREIQVLERFGLDPAHPAVDRLRAEAAREGCDAIYVKPTQVINRGRGDAASATCVVYTDAPSRSAPSTASPGNAAPIVGAVLKQ